jgi:hypothetical protein
MEFEFYNNDENEVLKMEKAKVYKKNGNSEKNESEKIGTKDDNGIEMYWNIDNNDYEEEKKKFEKTYEKYYDIINIIEEYRHMDERFQSISINDVISINEFEMPYCDAHIDDIEIIYDFIDEIMACLTKFKYDIDVKSRQIIFYNIFNKFKFFRV